MTDRHPSSSADAPETGRSGPLTSDEREKWVRALRVLSSYLREYQNDPTNCIKSVRSAIAPHISASQHYVPSYYLQRSRYDTSVLRNLLTHKTGFVSPGLAYDQLRLWDDQRELSDDFYTAVLKLLAEHRPDLFLQVASEMLEKSLDNSQKTRTYRVLLESLAALDVEDIGKASTPGADQGRDSRERPE
jgi:hypothetical protein